MPSSGTNSVCIRGVKCFCFPTAANAYRVAPHAAHSPESPAQLEYDRQLEPGASAGGPGFRIFVTVSPRGSSSNGIAPALMLGVNCRSSPPTWGMWMSPTPTGISKPFRSYFNWPPTAWERTGSEINSEHLQLSVSGSAFLHRPFANTAGGESTHYRGIPGHLSFVAPVRRNASSARAIPTTDGRYRCALPGEVPGRP